jgi:hypothetical protein
MVGYRAAKTNAPLLFLQKSKRALLPREFSPPFRINSCNGATLDGRSPIKSAFIRRDRLYFVFRKLKMFFTEQGPV